MQATEIGGEVGFYTSTGKKAEKIADGLDMGYQRKRRAKNDNMVFCLSNWAGPSITEMAESIGLWGRNRSWFGHGSFEMSTGQGRGDSYKLDSCLCLEFRKEIQAE